MSTKTEESTDTSVDKKPNETDQIKAEFSRKHESVLKLIEDQNKQMNAVVEALVRNQAAAAPQKAKADPDADLDDLAYSNPKEFARRVRESVKQEVRSENQEMFARQNEETTMLNQMVADYPELSDKSSELYQAAIKAYDSIPQSQRQGSLAMKSAIREAAADLGVVPIKRRKASNDDFTVTGSDSSSNRLRSTGKIKLDPRTLQFAKELGQDVEDPKYLERLTKSAQRQNWNKYGK